MTKNKEGYPPSLTSIREKSLDCPHCKLVIKIPIIENRYESVYEPITESSELSKIIQSQNKEYDNILDAFFDEHKRAQNLYNRCRKYDKVLNEWGMFHDDENLLQLSLKIGKGEFDKDDK